MSPTARCLAPILFAVLAVPSVASGPPAFTPSPEDSPSLAGARLFAFVKHFERAVNQRDSMAISNALDTGAMMDRVCEGLDVSPEQRREFADGALRSRWSAAYLHRLGEDGHIKLVRVRDDSGRSQALYRIVGDDGLDYHDAVLGVDDTGRIAIVDLYVFTGGEMMSQTLRRLLLEHMDSDRSVAPAAPGTGTVAADLAGLDQLMRSRNWADAEEAVTRIEEAVGDDPYLDTLRAYFLCEQGSFVRAAETAERSISGEPMLEEARLVRLRVALAQRDYAEVAHCLTVLERDFDWNLDSIADAPAYARFVRSPSCKMWFASRETALAR